MIDVGSNSTGFAYVIEVAKHMILPVFILTLLGVGSHAHQLKNLHYPQVSKNVILSKKLARKDDIFYESFNSR
ncbi:hypothetical protein CBR58_34075 [Bacillus thuringiensis]|nr:hypothetical protein CBR58_34075 [Bacillus thuringiensis]